MSSIEGGPFGKINNPSWEDIVKYSDSLAEMIRKSGFDPDIIVGRQRGYRCW